MKSEEWVEIYQRSRVCPASPQRWKSKWGGTSHTQDSLHGKGLQIIFSLSLCVAKASQGLRDWQTGLKNNSQHASEAGRELHNCLIIVRHVNTFCLFKSNHGCKVSHFVMLQREREHFREHEQDSPSPLHPLHFSALSDVNCSPSRPHPEKQTETKDEKQSFPSSFARFNLVIIHFIKGIHQMLFQEVFPPPPPPFLLSTAARRAPSL